MADEYLGACNAHYKLAGGVLSEEMPSLTDTLLREQAFVTSARDGIVAIGQSHPSRERIAYTLAHLNIAQGSSPIMHSKLTIYMYFQ